MKLYKRKDFLTLPEKTIYSRVHEGVLMQGLFCKTSDLTWNEDWIEQDLISECGFPNEITDGYDAYEYVLSLRDTFQEFKTDLNCGSRDGMFEETDVFVVWDKEDVQNLINYLLNCINNGNTGIITSTQL